MRKIIKNGSVIYGKELQIRKADILIQDNNILDIADNITVQDEQIIDATDCLIMPGLINAHLHSDENIFKAQYDNLPLELWMLYTYPTLHYGPFSHRFIYLRTMLGAIEMIKSGVTLAQDDASECPCSTMHGIGAIMQAYKDIGMRASVTTNASDKMWKDKIPFISDTVPKEMLMKYPPAANKEEYCKLLEEMIQKWHEPGGMLNVVLAPVAPQRCSDEFFIMINELSKKYSIPVHTHILETKMQALTGPLYYEGDSIIEHLHKLGLLSERMSIIHSVWMSDHDIELMADAKVTVVHNPASNLKLGSGIMPFRKFKNAGINIALGSDGMSSNDNQNIFEAMKLAALIHKVTNPDYKLWPSAKEVFTCATQGGAKSTMRQDHVGTLEAGKRADLVILSTKTVEFTPLNNILNHLVYCEHGSSIRKVMINGEIVVENGKILTIDEDALLEELRVLLPEFKEKYQKAKEWSDKLFPYVDQIYQKCVQTELNENRWSDAKQDWENRK